MSKHLLYSGVVYDGANDALERHIKDANKKLTRLGMPTIKMQYGASSHVDAVVGTPYPRKVRCWKYTIRAHLPEVKNWTFQGTLQQGADGGGNFVSNFSRSNRLDFNALRKAELTCDHCQKERERKTIYLLRSTDGDLIKVGDSCLKSFLGFRPDKAIRMMDIYSTLQKEAVMLNSKKGITSRITDDSYLDLKDFLKHALCAIEKQGYVKKDDGGQPTGHTAMRSCLNGPQLAYTNYSFAQLWGSYEKYAEFMGKQDERAESMIEWAKQQKDSKNTYLRNLSKIADDGWVSIRHANVAASIYHAYESRKYDAAQRQDRHASQPAEREQQWLHLRCAYIQKTKTKYGEKFLHKLYDNQGNGYGLFANFRKMKKGMFYNIKADISVPENADKMSSNLTFLRNIDAIEESGIDSPNPSRGNKDNEEYEPS